MATPGEVAREALLQLFAKSSTDCHAGGELRKALIEEKEGVTIFKFLDEFPLKIDDVVKNWITEQDFCVVDFRAVSKFGVFWIFEVSAVRILPPENNEPAEDFESC